MLAYILIIAGLLLRLAPHVPNTAPVAAIALFSGAYLRKKYVPWVPLALMMLSDAFIGLHEVVFYTWGSFAVIGIAGFYLRRRVSGGAVLGLTALSSLFFFFVTNFGVWTLWYPHTWTGLVSCYVNGLPFLRNTMASNMVFALFLFGSYELAKRILPERVSERVLAAADRASAG